MNRVEDVSNIYKLVKGKYGYMLANKFDVFIGKSIIEYGENCESELAMYRQLTKNLNKNIVEVGANTGTFTVPLAKMLQDKNLAVIAFEPQPFVFQNLCANLALNDITNVEAWPFACSDTMGQLFFRMPTYGKSGNFGGIPFTELKAEPKMASIPCVTLDHSLNGTSVGLLKVDAEGFELKVLKGATAIIDENRPILYVENDRPENSKELIEFIRDLNYQLWWHLPFVFNPNNFFKNSINVFKDNFAAINMLALPSEIKPQISNLDPVVSTDLEDAKQIFIERLKRESKSNE
jgi:FkbM family methyltransferase